MSSLFDVIENSLGADGRAGFARALGLSEHRLAEVLPADDIARIGLRLFRGLS